MVCTCVGVLGYLYELAALADTGVGTVMPTKILRLILSAGHGFMPALALLLTLSFLVAGGLQSSSKVYAADEPYVIYLPDNPPWGDSTTGDGFVVSILTAAFERADLPYKSVFVPWKRGQLQVRETAFGFLAPLTRLERREDVYQWVAPLNVSFLQLVTLDKKLAESEWHTLLDVPVVARMESPAQFLLEEMKFRHITLVEDERAAARVIRAKRALLWMQRGLPGNWAYAEAGGNAKDLHIIHHKKTPIQYLVASKGVSKDTIVRLRRALFAMYIEGEIDRIKQSYFSEKLDCELLLGCATGQQQLLSSTEQPARQ